MPEGPIYIKRFDPTQGETEDSAAAVTISSKMIWRLANAFIPNQPLNVDRVLGASYNTRSVLEALLVHTPQFYYCYPGRIESIYATDKVKKGHKHIMWKPEDPHDIGKPYEAETDIVISEVPSLEVYYDSLVLPEVKDVDGLNIDIKRRHAQIQIALYYIGRHLGYRIWIAQNDKGILYQNKRIGEFDGVISRLADEKLITAHEEAVRAALMIDCIWFKNGRLMPAVMEVEHSTGVTSGLTRMKNFFDKFPPFPTRYVIVASDEDRDKVIKEANKKQFKDLEVKFFPYSAVEEMYALFQKRNIQGVTDQFIDAFMEDVIKE